MSRAEQLRPWADAPCPGKAVEVPVGDRRTDLVHMHGNTPADDCTGLDPRFDALRGEHLWHYVGLGDHDCVHCDLRVNDLGSHNPVCLRTDLGALVRVAAACGLFVTIGVYSKDSGFYEVALSKFFESEGEWTADALEVEDAFAAALVAALPERAS